MIDTKEAKTGKGFYCYLKKVLIIFSLLIITSCSFLFPKPPTQQPTTSPIEVPDTDLIIEGQLSDLQSKAAKKLALNAPNQTEIYAQQGVVNSVITGSSIAPGQTPEEQIQTYFTENDDLYQISQFSQNFQKVRQFDQPNGTQIQQFQQIINEIPVYRSDIRVMLDPQGTIALVNSNYMPDSLFPPTFTPKLNSTSAKAAFETLNFSLPEDAQPTLVFYSPVMVGKTGPSFLAWITEAGWDGNYGDVLIKDSDKTLVSTNTAILTFSYEVRDYQKDVFDVLDPTTYPTQNRISTKPLLAASYPGDYPDINKVDHLIDYFTTVNNYYETNFNYSKFYTMDSDLKILVNLRIEGLDSPFTLRKDSPFSYKNDQHSIPPLIAFTDKKSEQGIDVFAHEFQHHVTNDFVTLEHNYENAQSSALSEAFSDFFAAVADPSEQRWQILLRGKPIRDMQDPTNGVPYITFPDHLNKFVHPKPNTSGEDEYGNGHLNSTIISHALYLLSEGGEKSGIKVYGIGIDTTAQIVFHSLPLLNNNAKFREARNAMLITCRNFIASGKLSKNHCNQVQNAFAAVGIGESASESSIPTTSLNGLQFGWAQSPNLAPTNVEYGNNFRVYEDLAHIGFSFVRENLPWILIQQKEDAPIDLNFGVFPKDVWARSIENNSLNVMATVLGGPPLWRSDISDEDFLRVWRNYLYQLVPELTETVDYWEIGTQPNKPRTWRDFRPIADSVEPELYAEMLKIAYEVIKVSEKNDVVILGGLNILAGSNYLGIDPLAFIKRISSTCQSKCFDAVGLYVEWGDYLADQSRDLSWDGKRIKMDMPSYIDLAVRDIKRVSGDSTPIWITDIGWDHELSSRLAEEKQIEMFEAESEIVVKTIVSLASNKSVEVVFYQDFHDYNKTRVFGPDIYSLVYLLSRSEPRGRFPVYSTNNTVLEQVSQFRFSKTNSQDAAFVWTNDSTIWGSLAIVETLEDYNSNMQKFTDFPDAGEVVDISHDSEFQIQKSITLLLAEMNSQDKLIVNGSNNIEYEQIKIWNWGNPEFYLTYDPADWEATDYASLMSKSYPYCVVASNGFRDGGPEGPPPYTYTSDTKILDGIEYFIDIEIPNSTGIPDMFHVYWEEHQNAVALFPDPEGFDECLAAFWEVMQLSAANNFAP